MKELNQIHFTNRIEFRKWLETNYDKSPGIWMIFFKKHAQAAGIPYAEALEEALCFGWIDSIIKKVDEDKYVRKFTPRKDKRNWSAINKKVVNQLVERGLMTVAGLEKIDSYKKTGEIKWLDEKPIKDVSPGKSSKETLSPGFIIDELAKNEPALTNFNKLAPSHRKRYIMWITSATREETIQKRLRESVSLLKGDKKLGLK